MMTTPSHPGELIRIPRFLMRAYTQISDLGQLVAQLIAPLAQLLDRISLKGHPGLLYLTVNTAVRYYRFHPYPFKPSRFPLLS
jgi:hypothetical protein